MTLFENHCSIDPRRLLQGIGAMAEISPVSVATIPAGDARHQVKMGSDGD